MNVLIAEDAALSARLLENTLSRAGHSVTVASNGVEALEALRAGTYDALLTDWMMPQMDGIELIRRVRSTIRPAPIILLITALDSPEDRVVALQAGADDYIVKPYDRRQVLDRLASAVARRDQPLPPAARRPTIHPAGRAPFVAVSIAASTGGPAAVIQIFQRLERLDNAAFFVVVHGPGWMLEAFARRLSENAAMPVALADEGQLVAPGRIYVAPGACHTELLPGQTRLRLVDGPPENYVRPAADPLFRSVARNFGRSVVGVVLTGLGRDGADGCDHIAAAGGKVIVQDPASAIAPYMPQSVLSLGIDADVASPTDLPQLITRHVRGRSVVG